MRTREEARRGGRGHRARPSARGTVQAVQTRPWCHLDHHPLPDSLSARVSQAAHGMRHVHARLTIADVKGEQGRKRWNVGTRGGWRGEDDPSAKCMLRAQLSPTCTAIGPWGNGKDGSQSWFLQAAHPFGKTAPRRSPPPLGWCVPPAPRGLGDDAAQSPVPHRGCVRGHRQWTGHHLASQ